MKREKTFEFWHELHRRRVLRVALGYMVFCFVIVNLLALAVESWNWPSPVLATSVWTFTAMLPVVIFVAWRYDYTPKGIIETPEHGEIPRWPLGLLDRRVEAVIIAVLMILLGFAIRGMYIEMAESDNGSATPVETEIQPSMN